MHFRATKKLGAEVYLNDPIGKDKDDNVVTLQEVLENDERSVEDSVDLKMKIKLLYDKMNSINANYDGWPASEMYSFVNTDIYNALPSDLQNVIIDTYTVSGHGRNDSTNFTSTDKLYLLSTKEVWGKEGTSNTITFDSAEAETRQLDYYKNNGVTTDSYSGAVKIYQGSSNSWWLRAADSETSYKFHSVNASGDRYYNYAGDSCGVAPAFRIG